MKNPGLPANWESLAEKNKKKYKDFLNRVRVKKIYPQLPALHQAVFNVVDCLECGNCCKGYSPRFKTPDIKRLSQHLKMKESAFIDAYLVMDEDGDYVNKSQPCPFLAHGNKCMVYDNRPSDCRRFPYTDEDVFVKRKNITLKNASFCPAVFLLLETLMEEISGK